MENINNDYGKWIYNTDDFTPAYRCSNCGYNKPMVANQIDQWPMRFCPNCGTRMEVKNKFSMQSISVMKAAKTEYAVFGGDVIYFQNKIGIRVFCVPSYMIPEMEKGDVIEISEL